MLGAFEQLGAVLLNAHHNVICRWRVGRSGKAGRLVWVSRPLALGYEAQVREASRADAVGHTCAHTR